MTEYVLRLIKDGDTSGFVEDDLKDLHDAVNWAYFFLGFYRCQRAEIFHAGQEEVPVAEIDVPPQVFRTHFDFARLAS